MKKTFALVLGASAVVTVSAHAAPPVAALRKEETLVMPVVQVTRVDEPAQCGEKHHEHLKLANHTGKAWTGDVELFAQGGKAALKIKLDASGDGASKDVDIQTTNNLECQQPLGVHSVKVLQVTPVQKLAFDEGYSPVSVSGEQNFAPPIASNKPFIKTLRYTINCNGPSDASAWVGSMLVPTPVIASVQFEVGPRHTTVNASVPPNQTIQVPFAYDGTGLCTMTAGAPDLAARVANPGGPPSPMIHLSPSTVHFVKL